MRPVRKIDDDLLCGSCRDFTKWHQSILHTSFKNLWFQSGTAFELTWPKDLSHVAMFDEVPGRGTLNA